METIQHIIIDNTLKRIGETQFADYLCHAYCYDGYCTFERNGQSFRFEAGDCLIICDTGVHRDVNAPEQLRYARPVISVSEPYHEVEA